MSPPLTSPVAQPYMSWSGLTHPTPAAYQRAISLPTHLPTPATSQRTIPLPTYSPTPAAFQTAIPMPAPSSTPAASETGIPLPTRSPITSCGDVSSGIGDLNLDRVLEDWDFRGLVMTADGLQVAANSLSEDNIQPATVAIETRNPSNAANVDGNHPFATPIDSACSVSYQQDKNRNRQFIDPKFSSDCARSTLSAEGNNSTVDRLLSTSTLQSDVKRARELAKSQKQLHSEEKVGTLVVLLARNVFFNDQILRSSTVFGKSTYNALNSDRLSSL